MNKAEVYEMMKEHYGMSSVEELILDMMNDQGYPGSGLSRKAAERRSHRAVADICNGRLSAQLCMEYDEYLLQCAY